MPVRPAAVGPPGPGGHNNLSNSALAGLLILVVIFIQAKGFWDGHINSQLRLLQKNTFRGKSCFSGHYAFMILRFF